MNNDRILVWDLPVRLFHWLLVACFAGAWLTAESERWRDVHVLLGYSLFGLIAFRLVWGFVGSRYARFASFAAGPVRVCRYVLSLAKAAPEHHIGHNPAGAWAIFLLIALALLTTATGYMNYQDLGGDVLEELHEGAASAMLLVAGIHVAGVVFSSFAHRENLVGSMITGMKRGASADGIASPRRLVAVALLAAVGAFWTFALRGELPAVYNPGVAASSAAKADHNNGD